MNTSIKVLYVEDNEGDVELFLMCLERYGIKHIELNIVDTVSEAQAQFEQGKYQAALIDWNLPDGQGCEIAEFIRRTDNQLPIIFLSGVLTAGHYEQAAKYCPKGCFEKDYDEVMIEKLIQLISV